MTTHTYDSKRKQNFRLARACDSEGDSKRAASYYSAAVDVTPLMAYEVILELRSMNVEYVVAPYEADAQLAYLCSIGYIESVISEDSDLLVFGCKRVIFKMKLDGWGQEIKLLNLGANTTMSFDKWTHDMFMHMCILSGCDYIKSLPKFGLKTAYTNISKYKHWQKVLKWLKFDGKTKIPKDYQKSFQKV